MSQQLPYARPLGSESHGRLRRPESASFRVTEAGVPPFQRSTQPGSRLPALEAQARGDLESAWASGAEDLVDSISRLTKGGLVQYRVIICEVRDIEHVEALHREIERNPLANWDGFRHPEIRGGKRAAARKTSGSVMTGMIWFSAVCLR